MFAVVSNPANSSMIAIPVTSMSSRSSTNPLITSSAGAARLPCTSSYKYPNNASPDASRTSVLMVGSTISCDFCWKNS